MKFLFYFFALITFLPSYGQLQIKPQDQLHQSNEKVTEFLKNNHFDYGILAWSTSNWISLEDTFSGFFVQDGKGYIVKIVSYNLPSYKKDLEIHQKELSRKELRSVRSFLNSNAAFRYNQEILDSLPNQCVVTEDGTVSNYTICQNTVYLAEVSKGYVKSVSKYAAEQILTYCAGQNPELKKLKGLVNTWRLLTDASRRPFGKAKNQN